MKLIDVKNQLGIAGIKTGLELSEDQKWYSGFVAPANIRIFLTKETFDKIKAENAEVTYTKQPRLSKKGKKYEQIQIHLANDQEFDAYL